MGNERAVYPFTISGTILLVLALTLLFRGFVLRNPYALVVSIVALPVLILLVMVVIFIIRKQL